MIRLLQVQSSISPSSQMHKFQGVHLVIYFV